MNLFIISTDRLTRPNSLVIRITIYTALVFDRRPPHGSQKGCVAAALLEGDKVFRLRDKDKAIMNNIQAVLCDCIGVEST